MHILFLQIFNLMHQIQEDDLENLEVNNCLMWFKAVSIVIFILYICSTISLVVKRYSVITIRCNFRSKALTRIIFFQGDSIVYFCINRSGNSLIFKLHRVLALAIDTFCIKAEFVLFSKFFSNYKVIPKVNVFCALNQIE